MVVWLHMHGEIRHFDIVGCIIHFWFTWFTNYQNRSTFASHWKKFIAMFLWTSV